jgi:hypothetical protein
VGVGVAVGAGVAAGAGLAAQDVPQPVLVPVSEQVRRVPVEMRMLVSDVSGIVK